MRNKEQLKEIIEKAGGLFIIIDAIGLWYNDPVTESTMLELDIDVVSVEHIKYRLLRKQEGF